MMMMMIMTNRIRKTILGRHTEKRLFREKTGYKEHFDETGTLTTLTLFFMMRTPCRTFCFLVGCSSVLLEVVGAGGKVGEAEEAAMVCFSNDSDTSTSMLLETEI